MGEVCNSNKRSLFQSCTRNCSTSHCFIEKAGPLLGNASSPPASASSSADAPKAVAGWTSHIKHLPAAEQEQGQGHLRKHEPLALPGVWSTGTWLSTPYDSSTMEMVNCSHYLFLLHHTLSLFCRFVSFIKIFVLIYLPL